jgi:hypothetical protein
MDQPFSLLLAQAAEVAIDYEPVRQSYLAWMYNALGIKYAALLTLSGLCVFFVVIAAVIFCKRPATLASFLVLLPLPFLIGVFASVEGMIASWSVMATSTTSPNPSELGLGISTALFSTLVGLVVTFPSYLLMAIGLPLRAIAHRQDSPSP